MISWAPVLAVLLRHLHMWKRDLNMMLGGFYWPLLDVFIWGYLGTWIQQANTNFRNYEAAALLGILLWQIVGRGCIFIVVTFAEEIWSHNLVNLFSLPLRISEWMCGVILFYFLGIMSSVLFCMLFIKILYNVSLWYIFSTFVIFFPPLFLCGIWLGFTCLQIIVMLGRRGTELGFVLGWLFMPFCGAYYPTEVLPQWGQTVSKFLPMSYIFKGMREYVMHQQNPTMYWLKGFAMSIPYALCALVLFVYFFNRSKRNGLARLVD